MRSIDKDMERESFKDYVERRQRVDENIFTNIAASLGYNFNRWGTRDVNKLKMADHMDKFGHAYSKAFPPMSQAVTDMQSLKIGPNKGLTKATKALDKNLDDLEDGWANMTSKAISRKIPVRNTYVP
jgi:hypothetical protein